MRLDHLLSRETRQWASPFGDDRTGSFQVKLPDFQVRALFVSLFLELGAEAAQSADPQGRRGFSRLYETQALRQLRLRE